MASIYQLKPRFQSLLRPLVVDLARAGRTANEITLAAAGISVVCGLLLAVFRSHAVLLVLPIVLFVRMALNAIDGMLAREHGQASRLGAVLNELGDVVSDVALYLPLIFHFAAPAYLMVLIIIGAVIAEMTGVIAIQIGAARRYDGPFGKSDRAAVFGALAVLVAVGMPQSRWMTPLLWVLLALSVATIVNRVRGALREAAAHA